MREIAENILDIAQNSVVANSTLIKINIAIDRKKDILSFEIVDNGKGMSEEFLQKVADPFVTTRTTRSVGMGLPLLKYLTIIAGGEFDISSKVGVGTRVFASFQISSVDRLPLGRLDETFLVLIGNEQIDFVFSVTSGEKNYTFDTREAKQVLEGISICNPEVLQVIKAELQENISEIVGENI